MRIAYIQEEVALCSLELRERPGQVTDLGVVSIGGP